MKYDNYQTAKFGEWKKNLVIKKISNENCKSKIEINNGKQLR